MVNLETKSVEIQNHMHDSVTQDFDRLSDLNDNGLTPLQGHKMNGQKLVMEQKMPLRMM